MKVKFEITLSSVIDALRKDTLINRAITAKEYGMVEGVDYVQAESDLLLNASSAKALYVIALNKYERNIDFPPTLTRTHLHKGLSIDDVVEGLLSVPSNQEGVYQIDDVYIGASENMRKRIRNHIYCALFGSHGSARLQFHITKRITEGQKIKVKILSWRKNDELEIVTKQSETLPLLNNMSAFFFSNQLTTI